MRSIFGLAESAFRSMFWLILLLILAFAILKFTEDRNVPVLSAMAEWINDHAKPQGS